MSFLLECPHCGLRDVNEFGYQGELTQRPPERPTLRALTEYVYFRRNVAGVQREWWQHRFGCEIWFLAERDTRTNEVLSVELPQRSRAEGTPAGARRRAARSSAPRSSGCRARRRTTPGTPSGETTTRAARPRRCGGSRGSRSARGASARRAACA